MSQLKYTIHLNISIGFTGYKNNFPDVPNKKKLLTCISISALDAIRNCLPTASNIIPSSAKIYSTEFIRPSTRLRTRAKACSWTDGSGSAL